MENHATTSIHFLNHEMVEDHFLFGSLNNVLFNTVLCNETIDIYLQNISDEKSIKLEKHVQQKASAIN